MNLNQKTKLNDAVNYLRARGKYIADVGCKFTPTPAAATDVAKTIREFVKAQKVSVQ